MKALALITQSDKKNDRWQFDKVMSAITFDLEIVVVFLGEGLSQLQYNKAWKSLEIYGVNEVYYLSNTSFDVNQSLCAVQLINTSTLQHMISNAEIIL